MCNNSGPRSPPASFAATEGSMNFPSSKNALTLCIVIRLEALGDSRIIGSRFLAGAELVTVGAFRSREKKCDLAVRDTLEKSVGLVPLRIVNREVIVRSLELIRRIVVLRPLTVEAPLISADAGSTLAALEILSSTE